jgi:hypothetical protein
MFSTRCTHCRQLINLKTEEVRAAVAESEEKHEKIYVMHCPKCRKLVKLQVKQLKLKIPSDVVPVPEATPEAATDEGTPS